MSRSCVVFLLLLFSGCASLTPPHSRERTLRYTPLFDAEPTLTYQSSDERPRTLSSRDAAKPRGQSAARTHQAVLGAVDDVRSSTDGITHSLQELAGSQAGLRRANGVFTRYTFYGAHQLRWINDALGGTTQLASAASEVADPDMALSILRLTGPRLQAALFGALLLSAWVDFLHLADVVLRRCPLYSTERLLADLTHVQKLIDPSMRALSSLEPAQVEAAATALPDLMRQLTLKFHSIREAVRLATEHGGQLMLAAQLVEMLTLASAMKMSLPQLPPAAPATLGVGLVVGSNGLMMGTRLVVSAEWVEKMRQLAQAGILSIPIISAAVRIHAGPVLMSQSHRDLPQGVRDALGDGPEVRGMRETGRTGAGMAEPPRHHVLPDEHREWFEKRGFTGDMDIDQFCVRLETAQHQAIHGGGDWRLGRTWPGEWNQMIMKALQKAEARAGRILTPSEILKVVAGYMKEYRIPMDFVSGRRR